MISLMETDDTLQLIPDFLPSVLPSHSPSPYSILSWPWAYSHPEKNVKVVETWERYSRRSSTHPTLGGSLSLGWGLPKQDRPCPPPPLNYRTHTLLTLASIVSFKFVTLPIMASDIFGGAASAIYPFCYILRNI